MRRITNISGSPVTVSIVKSASRQVKAGTESRGTAYVLRPRGGHVDIPDEDYLVSEEYIEPLRKKGLIIVSDSINPDEEPRIYVGWKGLWLSTSEYVIGDVAHLAGTTYVAIKDSQNVIPPNVSYWHPIGSAVGSSGYSGTSGYSGYSGTSGYSGDSGASGYSGSGISGYSGTSGYSGEGQSGHSGESGSSGESGTSGYSGESGTSGYSGESGTSGYSGNRGKGLNLRYTHESGVPTSGTQFLRTGQGVMSSSCGDRIRDSGTLITITIEVNTADASRSYDVDILSSPSSAPAVISTLVLPVGNKSATLGVSVAIAANTEIGARLVRVSGSGKSTFVSANVNIIIAE